MIESGKMGGDIRDFNIKKFLIKRGTTVGMIITLLVIGIRAPLFFDPTNLLDIVRQGSILSLIAIAQMIVFSAGGFNMSAGALVQFTSNVAAGMIISTASPAAVFGILLLCGLFVGLINAFMVNIIKVPAFVATLGMMFVLNGASLWYNQGQELTFTEQPFFSMLGRGYIGFVPVISIVVLGLTVFFHVFMKHTVTGLRMYSVGENLAAAQLRGIRNKKCILIAFCLAGVLLGLTGILKTSYNYGASALNTGIDLLITALAAALLGSTFSKTGELSVIGTVISALFITAIQNGLILNSVNNLLMDGILGIILILSVLLTVISKKDIGQINIF